jgi:iron complex transport system ATP-binding protein
MLKTHDVTVQFDSATVVDRVCCHVDSGEWVALIGPNGAGKSTLLRAMAHLQAYTGRIVIDEVATRSLSYRRHARLVAYVPQQPEVPAGMTVLDYTLLGRTAHIGRFGVETGEDHRRCLALLERLGIDHLAARALPTLSGGEMQRAVLARALAQDAPVLLLDEPTSALDLGNRVEALELVDELRIERSLTVVTVLHDLTLAAQFADRLLLMDAGRLAAAGAPETVLDPAALGAIFGRRVQVIRDHTGRMIVAPAREPRLKKAAGE